MLRCQPAWTWTPNFFEKCLKATFHLQAGNKIRILIVAFHASNKQPTASAFIQAVNQAKRLFRKTIEMFLRNVSSKQRWPG